MLWNKFNFPTNTLKSVILLNPHKLTFQHQNLTMNHPTGVEKAKVCFQKSVNLVHGVNLRTKKTAMVCQKLSKPRFKIATPSQSGI